jgi:hypothetical protein
LHVSPQNYRARSTQHLANDSSVNPLNRDAE